MHIENATVADIPELSRLLATLFEQEAEFAADHARQARGLALIIAQPDIGVILVARQQGRVIGMVNLLFTVSTALGAKVALLEDMVVAADQRDAGVGSLLLHSAIQQATAAGCRRITLLTDQSNDAAQRFYQRSGFAPSTMLPMRLVLQP